MKNVAFCHKGMEAVSSEEIKNILGKETSVEDGFLVFEAEEKELLTLCYKSQTLLRICILIDKFNFEKTPLEHVEKNLKNYNLKKLINENTITANCEREGKHDFNSFELSNDLAKLINKKLKNEINFKNAQTKFYLFIQEKKCLFCLDISGDLSIRDYRLFIGRDNLKPTLASCMIHLSGFDQKKSLINLFCKSGTIAIESALMSNNISPHYYSKEKFPFFNTFKNFDKQEFFDELDKKANLEEAKSKLFAIDDNFRAIQASKKNAKLAGVIKLLNFSKYEMEWLDIKFEKESFDCIVTVPELPENKLDYFFRLLNYLLKKDGKAIIGLKKDIEIKRKDIKVENHIKAYQGREEWNIYMVSKM